MTKNITGSVARYFELDKYATTIRTEFIAGLSTYLSLAYIFIVNPAVLSQAGIDPTAALFATALIASLSTLAMGLWANLPFAVAPGLTMNSYFVFVVCHKMNFTWQQGLATVFVSGVICVILTALPLRQNIVDSIPLGLKRAIAVTLGVFIATIGLFLAKMVAFSPSGLIDLSASNAQSLTSPLAKVFLAGLIVSILLGLKRLHFPAGMLIAIVFAAFLYHMLLPGAEVAPSNGDMFASVGQLDFSVFFHSEFWVPVIVFFVLDFFEGIGGFIGMTSNTSIQDKDGNVPHLKQGLWVDGFGTIGGSLFGTSSLIIFVESAVGINVGGRTGLTAVFCGLFMIVGAIASFYFIPALTMIPAQAAAGVLTYVGYLILSSSLQSKKDHGLTRFDFAVMSIMGVIAFATFSLDKSLAFGMWAYFGLSLIPGDGRRPAGWLALIASALTLAIVVSG
jgi:AGZA family xanthine/uracil permease-like MFS transporter